MAWDDSDRAARLPADWRQRRDWVRARAGGRCEATLHDGSRCAAPGSDCDHVTRGDDHRVENLQWLCPWHHKRKTHAEAVAELAARRRRAESPRRPHPGLIESTLEVEQVFETVGRPGGGDPARPPVPLS